MLALKSASMRRLSIHLMTSLANLIFGALKAELFVYKRVAMEAPPDLSSWGFWVKYCLRLPVWYKVASEGALVVVSSASVERLFSILASQIHDSQSRALFF